MVITWNLFKQRSDVQVVVVVLASKIVFVKRIFCKSEENDHSNNQFCTTPAKKTNTFFVQSSSTNMAGKYKFLLCFSETTIEYPLEFTVEVCYVKYTMSYIVFLHPVQCSQYQQSWYRNHPLSVSNSTMRCCGRWSTLLDAIFGIKKASIQLQAFQGV